MSYVAGEILGVIFLAAFIGGVVGWLLRSLRGDKKHGVTDQRLQDNTHTLQSELAEAKGKTRLCEAAVAERDTTIAQLRQRIGEMEKQQLPAPVSPSKSSPRIPRAKDDLKRIGGIGRALEGRLNRLGIKTFRQIASWTKEDIERVSKQLKSFPRRIHRDNWVRGAKEQHFKKYGEKL